MASYFRDAGEDEPLSAAVSESGNGPVYLPLFRRAEMDRYLPLFRRAEMDRYLPLFWRAEMDRYLPLFRRAEMAWHLPLLWKLDGSRFLSLFRKQAVICRRFGFWKSGISGEVRPVSTGGVLAGCGYRKIWEVACKWEKYMVMYV